MTKKREEREAKPRKAKAKRPKVGEQVFPLALIPEPVAAGAPRRVAPAGNREQSLEIRFGGLILTIRRAT